MGWLDQAVGTVTNVAKKITPVQGAMLGGGFGAMAASAIGGGQQPGQPLNYGGGAAERNADMQAGFAKGKELFYDDPDMQMMRDKRMDLAKGYDGQQMGAMRSQARNEIQGQRQGYLRSMSGNIARGGIGGARAAAMKANADQGFQQKGAEMERKMTLDNANLMRTGTNEAQDFLMRQKYGMLGTGMGYAQLGVTDRGAAAQAAAAGKEEKKGLLGQIIDGTGLF